MSDGKKYKARGGVSRGNGDDAYASVAFAIEISDEEAHGLMRLLDGMLRFRVQHLLACAGPVRSRAIGWLACLCTAATALVAFAVPTPTFEEPSLLSAPNLLDEMLIIGNMAGLSAGWMSGRRPLLGTSESGPVDAALMPVAAAGSNQTSDHGVRLSDWQLEFVTIAGVAYSTGIGPDPATCGPAAAGQTCVAIYDGLLEIDFARTNETQYLVN